MSPNRSAVRHPESKSLGPDGKPCQPDTRGLLQRAHITAGEIRYVDKESSSMWSQGDDLSVALDIEENRLQGGRVWKAEESSCER